MSLGIAIGELGLLWDLLIIVTTNITYNHVMSCLNGIMMKVGIHVVWVPGLVVSVFDS
jgi:hypothetical protein